MSCQRQLNQVPKWKRTKIANNVMAAAGRCLKPCFQRVVKHATPGAGFKLFERSEFLKPARLSGVACVAYSERAWCRECAVGGVSCAGRSEA